MTPSSSPSSSTGSAPDSSPADTTFSDNSTTITTTTRPSFVPLTLQPFPQTQASLSSAASRSSRSLVPPHERSTPPSAQSISETSTTGHRTFHHGHTHGKQQYSRDSPILDMDMMSPSAGTNPPSEEEDSHLDLEHELENVHGSGGGGSQTSPQTSTGKKKRTRTLTTPYQSAVLHALLAQSRFPTTAMREEVGRSIGLSARKVQVWFQNQRQKARKPRTQGQGQGQERAGSLDSPQSQAQFGPFNPITGSSNTPMAGSSTDLMTRTSYSSDDLIVSRSSSDSIMRGLPIPAPPAQVGSGGGISTESEFHLGLGYTGSGGGSGGGGGGGGSQVKIEGSSPEPPPTRFLRVSTPPTPAPALPPTSSSSSQHPYYTLLPTTSTSSSSSLGRSLNPQQQNHLPLSQPQPPPPSRYPFTVVRGPSDPFSADTPVILPPLRLGNPNMYERTSTSTITRHDPQLRYSASFPSFPQETSIMSGGGGRASAGSSLLRSPPPPSSSGSSSSSSSSSRSVLPPPFTLQPRPQWDWDRPLGVVLPSIGQMTSSSSPGGGSGFRQFSSFPQQPRPRTSSDPTLPFLEQRHSALLTQPWPLPPPPPTPRAIEHQGLVQYDPIATRGGGDEKGSVPPSSLDSKSRNRTPDMDYQPDRPPSLSFVPLSRPVEQQQQRNQLQRQNQEEDRMRYDSVTPKPSYFRG